MLPSGSSLLKQFPEEWTAPTASGAGSETFTQLAFTLRFPDPDVIGDLTAGDVETEAEFIVKFHV